MTGRFRASSCASASSAPSAAGIPGCIATRSAGAPRPARRRGRAGDDAGPGARWRAGSGTRARRSPCGSSRRRPATGGRRRAGRRRRRASPRRWRGGWRSSIAPPPTRSAGSTARPTGCPACTSTSTARAASVRCDGDGARAFYRGLPEQLRDAARGAPGSRCERSSSGGGPARARRRRGRRTGRGALLGAAPEGEIEVRENGLRFGVDLLRGQKGGLFLDQRDNRALVRTLARGRRVLNLFGYTGGFSIYAAAGGARATVTVDAARAGDRGGPPQLRAQQAGDGRRPLRGGRRVRVPRAGGARRRALRPGDLRPAELRAQPPRAGRPGCAPTGACIGCAPRSPRRAGRCARRRARATSTAPRSSPPCATARATPAGGSSCVELRGAAPTTPWCRNFRRATT